MLYHFPEESPSDLLEKERLLLQEQIKLASRVEKEGYRKKECSLPSFYIEYRCIHQYLKCPIKKWRLPRSPHAKVEVEPLPTDFISPYSIYKPLYFQDPETKEKVRRIVGFREIQQKREYVQYLKDVKGYADQGDDGDGDDNQNRELASGEEDEHSDTVSSSVESEEIRKYLEVARGGGPRKQPTKPPPPRGRGRPAGPPPPRGKQTQTFPPPKGGKKVPPPPPKKIDAKEAAHLKMEQSERNLADVFRYHEMFRVPIQTEKDNEWLQLSTSGDEENLFIKSFNKQHLPWMNKDLSFESQFLASTLMPFMISSTITGRSFLATKKDIEHGHVDFLHRKRDSINYVITSFLFWVCFVMLTVSFLEIQWENQQETLGVKQARGAVKTLEELQKHVEVSKHDVEELELNKYKIPIMLLMINLVLTAVWSLLVILGDGIYIAHYLNCWAAAMAEMETSACAGIRKKIILHHLYFLLYTGLMVTAFCFDFPRHVRYSSLETTVLLVRVFQEDVRINNEDYLFPFQVAGLVFQIYVTYASSMIKLLIQIFAIILKNASEMWNFKFALSFEQLTSRNRAHLLKLTLNHSLVKLFTHHRILTVLLRNFGEVFAIPIMIYMVCEMGVLTLVMVEMFFYKPLSKDLYGGQEYVIIKSKDTQAFPVIRIPYFHNASEDFLVFVFIGLQILFQYMGTTEILSRAGASFFAGYEFVRRSGTVLCRNAHQRRLIQSLEWSFSSTNPSVLSANSFFTINREMILSTFAAIIGFFSLIIQLQIPPTYKVIEFLEIKDCDEITDYTLERGGCQFSPTSQADLSMNFTMVQQG